MAASNGLVRRSIVFIPRPPDLPTFAATQLDDDTLLVFAKIELENPLRCWRVKITNSALSSAPVPLTGAADCVQPGFQAVRLGSTVCLVGGYRPTTHCREHLDVFVCKQRGSLLHVDRLVCSGARIPSPRTYDHSILFLHSHTRVGSSVQAYGVAWLGRSHTAGVWRMCRCAWCC